MAFPTAGPTDEDMLSQVQQSMGGQGGTMPGGQGGQQPPPGSGMKWQDLGEDQQALSSDPSPVNVAAFVSYWGIENMPPDLMNSGMAEEQGPGEPGADTGGDY
jgi:hypothetical protein